MESWSVIDIKNMSTAEMKQLMAKLQNEIKFRDEIGEEIKAHHQGSHDYQKGPQLISEAGLHTADDDPVAGI